MIDRRRMMKSAVSLAIAPALPAVAGSLTGLGKTPIHTAAEFRAAAGQLASTMRGNMVPADIYDMAVKERYAFRKSKGR